MPLRSGGGEGGNGRFHQSAALMPCPVRFGVRCPGVIGTAFLGAKLPWLFVPCELLCICWRSRFLLAGRMDSGFSSGSGEMRTTYRVTKKKKKKEKPSDVGLHNVCRF